MAMLPGFGGSMEPPSLASLVPLSFSFLLEFRRCLGVERNEMQD